MEGEQRQYLIVAPQLGVSGRKTVAEMHRHIPHVGEYTVGAVEVPIPDCVVQRVGRGTIVKLNHLGDGDAGGH